MRYLRWLFTAPHHRFEAAITCSACLGLLRAYILERGYLEHANNQVLLFIIGLASVLSSVVLAALDNTYLLLWLSASYSSPSSSSSSSGYGRCLER
ncbi:hypothetical protein NUW54_g13402 [Trametes sanguinea]|uniref:Uncharacterized protein n=1 Tax=Trametes sanguinea TaxID=158606 RepID=A0ACC1MM88_9APHY|nr:hypothetical protein NUW54_g13402 [Trametes sanguinea]